MPIYTARCLVLQHTGVACRAPGSANFETADPNACAMHCLVVSHHPATAMGHISLLTRSLGSAACRWAVFVGFGVLVVATPISFIFINKLTNLQGDMLAHTDRRIALVNQLLAGMKSLKMYAWEAAQEARVCLLHALLKASGDHSMLHSI